MQLQYIERVPEFVRGTLFVYVHIIRSQGMTNRNEER